MQEDLTVGICEAAIDRVATHDGNDVWILLGLVFPEDLGVVVEVERVDRVRERPMDVHDVADHERPAFVAAQNAGRKRPRHLQFADVCGGDLLELRVTVVGVISCRHHPIFRVLRHFYEFIVGMSGAHSEDRYGAHASREQEIAHRYPPCDNAAGDRRESTRSAAGRHPFGGKASGSVSQRNEAQRARRFPILTPRLAYEYVRIPVELTSLKPEAARKSIPRPDRSQPKTLGPSISLAQATHAMK